jgi:hypothetical protein
MGKGGREIGTLGKGGISLRIGSIRAGAYRANRQHAACWSLPTVTCRPPRGRGRGGPINYLDAGWADLVPRHQRPEPAELLDSSEYLVALPSPFR